MKKRLISFLLAVSMMLSILPAGAFADYSTRKELALKKASDGYFYPENSDSGTKDAEGNGWSYDHTTNTLTFDAPGETVYLTTHESLYDYRILSNVEVKANTTLYGIKTQLHGTTNNYGTILYADFYSSGDGKGNCVLNNYGLAKGVSLGSNTAEHDAIINNKSGGVIDLYVDRSSSGSGPDDSTANSWGSHITNEAGGTIQYAWFRRPIKNYGKLYTCQFSFSNATDPTLLNDGEILNSTFFGTGQSSDVHITGSGSIDHSYFKSVVGSVQNTITNSVIETDTCSFTSPIDTASLHVIRASEGTFSLESRDAPTSAYTFNAVTSISFVGSPKVYVYGSYGHNINRLNGEPLKISAASSIPGIASVDDIGQKSWSYTAVTFCPDGTQDITLSGEVFENKTCWPALIDGIPTESGDGWNYVDAKDFHGKTAKTLLIDPGYDAYFEEDAIIRVPVKTMGTYTNHSGLHGGIYTKGVSLQTDRTLENVLVFGEILPNSDKPSSKKQWLSLPQNCTVNGALDESRGTYIYGTADAYSDRTITVTMPEGTTNKQWAAYILLNYSTKGERLSSLPSQSGSFTDSTISFKMGSYEKLALELVDPDDNVDTKKDFTADLFTVTVDGKSLSEEFTAGTPHNIYVTAKDVSENFHVTQFFYYTYNETSEKYENRKTVNIEDKTTWPTNAGKYKIAIAANDNSGKYNPIEELTDDSWVFEIKASAPSAPHVPVAEDFAYSTLHIDTDNVDKLEERLMDKITTTNGISKDDVTITYVKDNIDLNAVPTEAGSYTFKISVKANAALNYTATEQPLTDTSWTFQIHTASYGVSVTGGQVYILRADGTKQYPGSELGVPVGTKVYLELNSEYAENPDFEFKGWQLAENSTKLDGNHDLTLKDDSYFTMPHGNVQLSLITDSGDQGDTDTVISSGDGAGTAVAVVLGGAAIGGVAYLAGTQLYLESVLPKGAAIPVNRQQLADLLWATAGKPQPQSSVLFTDISAEAIESQKAARWCVEQGLMQADGTSFKPGRHTFRPQVIKAWNDLQAMQKAD